MSKDFKVFDAIIIGAGQGGSPLATALAEADRQVALVERKHVGGTCINTGCTPTKTMIASARVAHLLSRAKDYGINSTFDSVDILKVRKRKQDIVESFRNGKRKALVSTPGLSLIEGEAHFIGKKELEVDFPNGRKEFIKAQTVVIDTGSSPFKPPIPGLDTIGALDSTSIMEIDELPQHLVIVGGGYVGVEFAQMFHRFGSKVTIVQKAKQLLPLEDEDVAEKIAEIFRQDGIDVMLDSETVTVAAPASKKIVLTIKTDDKELNLEGSHLLVATGRVPNTPSLNLESTAISVDERGFVPVNAKLETAVPGIYAIGDVNGGPAFTHISYDDFRIISKNLLENGNADTSGRVLPYVVFIDPQLGRIGMTEKAAKDTGHDYRVAKIPMSWAARAIETDETRGLMKAIVDAKTGQILGAAVLGVEGGEVMAILQVAMLGGLPYTVIRDAIFSHPTLSESLNTLFGHLTVKEGH
ncbi:MAG: mercuric reductase [Actinomycetota bacterium]